MLVTEFFCCNIVLAIFEALPETASCMWSAITISFSMILACEPVFRRSIFGVPPYYDFLKFDIGSVGFSIIFLITSFYAPSM